MTKKSIKLPASESYVWRWFLLIIALFLHEREITCLAHNYNVTEAANLSIKEVSELSHLAYNDFTRPEDFSSHIADYPHLYDYTLVSLCNNNSEGYYGFIVTKPNLGAVKDYIWVSRGTDLGNINDLDDNISILLGGMPDQVQEALNFGLTYIEKLNKFDRVIYVGHSLGGAISQYLHIHHYINSIKTGYHGQLSFAISFDAPGIGTYLKGMLDDGLISTSNMKQITQNIVHYNSFPNSINSFGKTLGKIYVVDSHRNIPTQKTLFSYIFDYTISQHAMANFKETLAYDGPCNPNITTLGAPWPSSILQGYEQFKNFQINPKGWLRLYQNLLGLNFYNKQILTQDHNVPEYLIEELPQECINPTLYCLFIGTQTIYRINETALKILSKAIMHHKC